MNDVTRAVFVQTVGLSLLPFKSIDAEIGGPLTKKNSLPEAGCFNPS